MKISLTNEELALFFTKELKGNILDSVTEKLGLFYYVI